jgi:hypothetical protein
MPEKRPRRLESGKNEIVLLTGSLACVVVDFLPAAEARLNLTVSREWRSVCAQSGAFSSIKIVLPKLEEEIRRSPWDARLQPNANEGRTGPENQLMRTRAVALRHTSILSSIRLSIHLRPTDEWLATFQGLPNLRKLVVDGVPSFSPAAVVDFVLSKSLSKLSLFGHLGTDRSQLYQAWATTDCEYPGILLTHIAYY